MMHEEMRTKLKLNAIKVVADQGIENLTTKKVAAASGIAETYIYRYFDGKADLLTRCYLDIDKKTIEFIDEKCNEFFEICNTPTEWFEKIWFAYWEFIMVNKEFAKFYLRFYNSGFNTESIKKRKMTTDLDASDIAQKLENRYNVKLADPEALKWHIKLFTLHYACRAMELGIADDEKEVRNTYNMIMSPIISKL